MSLSTRGATTPFASIRNSMSRMHTSAHSLKTRSACSTYTVCASRKLFLSMANCWSGNEKSTDSRARQIPVAIDVLPRQGLKGFLARVINVPGRFHSRHSSLDSTRYQKPSDGSSDSNPRESNDKVENHLNLQFPPTVMKSQRHPRG